MVAKNFVLDLNIAGVSESWVERFERARPRNKWSMLDSLIRLHPHAASFGSMKKAVEDEDDPLPLIDKEDGVDETVYGEEE